MECKNSKFENVTFWVFNKKIAEIIYILTVRVKISFDFLFNQKFTRGDDNMAGLLWFLLTFFFFNLRK